GSKQYFARRAEFDHRGFGHFVAMHARQPYRDSYRRRIRKKPCQLGDRAFYGIARTCGTGLRHIDLEKMRPEFPGMPVSNDPDTQTACTEQCCTTEAKVSKITLPVSN